MTKDEIIKLAHEAGLSDGDLWTCGITAVQRFAIACYEAGRTAEREACEKNAGEFARKWWGIHCASNKHMETTRKAHDDFCSLQNAIRARGMPGRSRFVGWR